MSARSVSLTLAAICCLTVFQYVTPVHAYKILLIPFGNHSHLLELHAIGRELLQRGHEVHIYLSVVDTPPSEVAAAGYKFIHPNTNRSLDPAITEEADLLASMSMSTLETLLTFHLEGQGFVDNYLQVASTILNDQATIERISKEKFDFVLADSVFLWYFTFIIPYKLGIPYGGMTALHQFINNRVPYFPSAYGEIMFSNLFGVEQAKLSDSLWNRLKNTMALLYHDVYLQYVLEEVFRQANVTYHEVVSKLSIQLVDQHYLLSGAMPSTAHTRYVGGLVTRPGKPISDPSLLHFVQSTDQPVVVCTFGTFLDSLSSDILVKLFGAFRRLSQYRVVMRMKLAEVDQYDVPDNVLLRAWLPQNDLLAHEKTALLITHSGNNGQNEALYHGVPMVAFYVFDDQGFNADRIVMRGFGVKLNLATFTDSQLADSIDGVIRNESYRKNMKRASEIFRAEQPAAELAADLLEHVIKFGSDHLRPDEAFDMSLTQFAMLDVMLILFVLATLILTVTCQVTLCLTKRLFRCRN